MSQALIERQEEVFLVASWSCFPVVSAAGANQCNQFKHTHMLWIVDMGYMTPLYTHTHSQCQSQCDVCSWPWEKNPHLISPQICMSAVGGWESWIWYDSCQHSCHIITPTNIHTHTCTCTHRTIYIVCRTLDDTSWHINTNPAVALCLIALILLTDLYCFVGCRPPWYTYRHTHTYAHTLDSALSRGRRYEAALLILALLLCGCHDNKRVRVLRHPKRHTCAHAHMQCWPLTLPLC